MNTSSVYVVTNYENKDLDELYLIKEEADAVCVEANASLSAIYKTGAYKNASDEDFNFLIKSMLYKVYSLYDAIENIKDRIREEVECDNRYK